MTNTNNSNNTITENELSQSPVEDFDFILSNTTETTDSTNTTIITIVPYFHIVLNSLSSSGSIKNTSLKLLIRFWFRFYTFVWG